MRLRSMLKNNHMVRTTPVLVSYPKQVQDSQNEGFVFTVNLIVRNFGQQSNLRSCLLLFVVMMLWDAKQEWIRAMEGPTSKKIKRT